MFASTKSIHGNTCGQIFVNNLDFMRFVPMRKKKAAGHALEEFFQDVGVPRHLHVDNAPELNSGHWKTVRESQGGIRQTTTEPYSPWQNRAEACIRELKKRVKRTMSSVNAPLALWDYCAVWVAETHSKIAHDTWQLKGRSPEEHVTGETPDITEYVEFDWYTPVFYWEPTNKFPDGKRCIGRWLGVAHRVGQAMCYWVLPRSCQVLARSTVQPMTADELANPEIIAALQ